MLTTQSTLVLAVATVAGHEERSRILHALTRLAPHRRLYVYGPNELAYDGLRVALLTGILLSIPVVAYLLCKATLPTTGALDPMLLAVPLLCVLGAMVGWVILLPVAIRDLMGSDPAAIHYLPRLRDFVDLTMGTLVASAVVLGSVGALILRRAG
jgi:Sec-independent protein secretion pathway component TatC